jgi:hypothetical protein
MSQKVTGVTYGSSFKQAVLQVSICDKLIAEKKEQRASIFFFCVYPCLLLTNL